MVKSAIAVKQTNPTSNFKRALLQFTALAGSAVFVTQPVLAQDADEEEEQASNVIIVSAQKRDEDLQDVPIAVSAFSQETLQIRGLLGGENLQQSVPNLSFQGNTGFGQTNFQIRGIGAGIEGISADTGVGIHVNAIPLAVNRIAEAEFYDLERVEVLRGPQGTLYGRNSTGGLVNMITARPEYVFSGRLNAEYGNYNTVRLGGHLNIPLSDTLAVRFAGNMIRRDGTVFNEGTGNDIDDRDIWSTRVTVGFEPSSSFSATLMWEHFEQDDNSGFHKGICANDPGPDSVGGVPTNPLTALFLSNGCLPTAVDDPRNTGAGVGLMTWAGAWGFVNMVSPPDFFAGQTLDRDLRVVSAPRDNQRVANNDLFSLNLELELGGGLSVTSITSYSEDESWFATPFQAAVPAIGFADTPLTPGGVFDDPVLGALSAPYNETQVDSTAEQWTQELRLSSDFDGPFNFNLGGIYIDLDRTNSVNIIANTTTIFATAWNLGIIPGSAGQIFIDQSANRASGDGRNYLAIPSEYNLSAAALFGEAYYDISDTLSATLGLRYTRDDKTFVALVPQLYVPGGEGQLRTPERETSFNELTGRFTLDWQFADDHLLYASVSRGYKGGGFNPGNLPVDQQTFDPEFVNAFELGTKSTFDNGRGLLNVSGFYYDYAGYQIASITNGIALNENTDATVWGIELETSWEIVDDFIVNATIGYLNTSIGDGTTKLNLFDLTQGDPSLTAVSSISGPTLSTQCVVPTAEVAGLLGAINANLAPPVALGFLCSGAPGTGAGASPNAFGGVPADISGNELPQAPNWTVALGAQYSADISNDLTAVLRADYAYRSSSFSEPFNTIYDRIPGYHNLNLSLTLSSFADDFDIQLYARNLLSQDTVISNRVLASNPGNYREVRGKEPVMFGIRLGIDF